MKAKRLKLRSESFESSVSVVTYTAVIAGIIPITPIAELLLINPLLPPFIASTVYASQDSLYVQVPFCPELRYFILYL